MSGTYSDVIDRFKQSLLYKNAVIVYQFHNFAWYPTYHGWLIDAQGNVTRYKMFADDEKSNEMANVRPYHIKSRFAGKITSRNWQEIWLPLVKKYRPLGQSDLRQVGYDMGSIEIYIRHVPVYESGGHEGYVESAKAIIDLIVQHLPMKP